MEDVLKKMKEVFLDVKTGNKGYFTKAVKLIDDFNSRDLILTLDESEELSTLLKIYETNKNSMELFNSLLNAKKMIDDYQSDVRMFNIQTKLDEEFPSSIIRLLYNCYITLGQRLGDEDIINDGAQINKLFIEKQNRLDSNKGLYV